MSVLFSCICVAVFLYLCACLQYQLFNHLTDFFAKSEMNFVPQEVILISYIFNLLRSLPKTVTDGSDISASYSSKPSYSAS